MPTIPWVALDYLRMDLHLTPNEYQDTSRATYEMADAVQRAYREGSAEAHQEKKAAGDRKIKEKASLERLKRKIGAG